MKDDVFFLTTLHVMLLRHACVRWDDMEWGAPGIDPRYPYGGSDVVRSIADVIGLDAADLSPRIGSGLERLHRETEVALQVILATCSFEPGTFRRKEQYDSRSWYRAGPLPDGHHPLPELDRVVALGHKDVQ